MAVNNLTVSMSDVHAATSQEYAAMPTSTGSSTLSLTGASGAQYEFELYSWGTEFKAVCAVYSISADQRNGYHTMIYIGQTGDCSTRFDAHHKAGCFNRRGATHIGILVENSERSRLAIEADLIAAYNPPCNG